MSNGNWSGSSILELPQGGSGVGIPEGLEAGTSSTGTNFGSATKTGGLTRGRNRGLFGVETSVGLLEVVDSAVWPDELRLLAALHTLAVQSGSSP